MRRRMWLWPDQLTRPGARLSLLLLFGLASVAGCGGLVDDDEGDVPLTEIPFDRQGVIPLRKGYAHGQPVQFYRLGTLAPKDTTWFPTYTKFPGLPVREMYVWVTPDGELSLDQTQRPIIDSLPLQAKASDFFELVAVTAPAGYSANDIKSRATLLRGDFALQYSGRVVNCPVVGPDAKLAPAAGKTLGTYPLVKLWYRKKTAHCLLMDGGRHMLGGSGAPTFKVSGTPLTSTRTEYRVLAGDLYAMIAKAFTGADQVTNIPVPDNDVFRYPPGDPSYSPLSKVWDVTVPSDYKVGQITSYATLFPVPDFTDPRIVERNPETFCNCPVVKVGK